MPSDVRAVANFVLNTARESGVEVTNMAINKIVFFLHVDYLLKYREPLTRAKIEAWEHGPVFRELYAAFKKYGDTPIQGWAKKISPNTGNEEICDIGFTVEQIDFLKPIVEQLLKLNATKLRNLSHLPGSPWDTVWNHIGNINVGMQISDEVILNCSVNSWRQ